MFQSDQHSVSLSVDLQAAYPVLVVIFASVEVVVWPAAESNMHPEDPLLPNSDDIVVINWQRQQHFHIQQVAVASADDTTVVDTRPVVAAGCIAPAAPHLRHPKRVADVSYIHPFVEQQQFVDVFAVAAAVVAAEGAVAGYCAEIDYTYSSHCRS